MKISFPFESNFQKYLNSNLNTMKKIILLFIPFFLIIQGCELDEVILDEALNSDLLEGPGAAEGILSPVYARMNGLFNGHEDYFLLQEGSTDEVIVPFRGGTDWFNGGRLIELYRHAWTSTLRNGSNVWNALTQGVARAAIAQNTLAT